LALFLLLAALTCVLARLPCADPNRLRRDLEKAAVRGDAEAQFRLAMLERPGKDPTEERQRALSWLRKAARQGHAQAQYELGLAYTGPHRDEGDLPLALKWLTKAAAQGYGKAWLALGNVFADGGTGVPQDIDQARVCYRKADELGDAKVWHDLGGVYRWGHGGVVADWPVAYRYYLKAARAGHAEAQHVVGQFCQHGIGTEADFAKAVSWYRQAALRGNPWAEEKMGWLYEHGIGVPRDREQALAWYRESQRHGGFGWLRRRRLGDPTLEREEPAAERFAPVTKDVEVVLEVEKTEYELDELVIIRFHYRNVSKETYSLVECHTGGFQEPFSVRDEDGREVPNPYAEANLGISGGSCRISVQPLAPGATHVVSKTLNQCARFERPGTYTVGASASVCRGTTDGLPNRKKERTVVVKPVTLTVRNCDATKRQRDIERLVKAFREGGAYPDGLARPAELFGGRENILRRLAFYNEPKLLLFFLDALEQGAAFAETALRALPSRAAVLAALEQRLEHPEKYHSLDLLYPYLRLAGLAYYDVLADPGGLGEWKREEEVIRKYRDKALRLVRHDKSYRYGYLVPDLLGGADDLFLIDYLIRCQPDLDLVVSCAHALKRVKLGREHVPFLKSLLGAQRGWDVADAAIVQLVRLEGPRHLEEVKAHPDHFSPAIRRFFLQPHED
jgi:TPR repeat protein